MKISNLAVSIIGRYFFKKYFLCYFHRFIIWNCCHKFLAKTEHFAFLKLWVGFRNKKFSKRQFLWNCLKHNNKLVNIKLPVSVNISDFFPDLANSWHLIFRHVTWLCNYVTSCQRYQIVMQHGDSWFMWKGYSLLKRFSSIKKAFKMHWISNHKKTPKKSQNTKPNIRILNRTKNTKIMRFGD